MVLIEVIRRREGFGKSDSSGNVNLWLFVKCKVKVEICFYKDIYFYD